MVVWGGISVHCAVLGGGKETLKRSWQVVRANFPIELPFLLANWLDLLACELRGFPLDDWGLQSL